MVRMVPDQGQDHGDRGRRGLSEPMRFDQRLRRAEHPVDHRVHDQLGSQEREVAQAT